MGSRRAAARLRRRMRLDRRRRKQRAAVREMALTGLSRWLRDDLQQRQAA